MILGIKDIIDILFVAAILFAIYRILRRSGASNLFWGILAFIFSWLLVSYVFHLELTSALFDRFVSVGAIALIVIFQEEIRGFFYRIGARFNIEQFKDRWSKIKHKTHTQQYVTPPSLELTGRRCRSRTTIRLSFSILPSRRR